MSNIGNKETFSKNLLYYLHRSGKTQKDIALEIGVTPAAINEWVRMKKYPRIDKIELLARYFGILKSDLIEERDNKRSDVEVFNLEFVDVTPRVRDVLEKFKNAPENTQEMLLQMIETALNTLK